MGYQSEAKLEEQLIKQLCDQDYEEVVIRSQNRPNQNTLQPVFAGCSFVSDFRQVGSPATAETIANTHC